MLNSAPYEWTIGHLMKRIKDGPHAERPDGTWEPARPFGMFSLRNRFRLAWMVFTGEADALRWSFQRPKAY